MTELNILINPEVFNSDKARTILNEIGDIIDKIPDIKLIWSENLYNVFFQDDYELAKNLYNNSYALIGKIFAKSRYIRESISEAESFPTLSFISDSIKSSFFKIVHTLLHESTLDLPFFNESNDSYLFKCTCHDSEMSAFSILSLKDYILREETILYDLFWPDNKNEFENKFSLILEYKEIVEGYDTAKRKYQQIEYSSSFMNSVIQFEQAFRDKLIESLVKRLHLSQDGAKRTSLKDEPIVNSDNRRFYITRDNGRIHYNYPCKNCIKFTRLSLDHDKGL